VRRREFITLLGGAAAAWPLAARAQQPAVPVIGFVGTGSPERTVYLLSAFRKGLSEAGFVEGKNVTIEYRWANNEYDRLPELTADLVRLRVAVITIPFSTVGTRVAKTATTTIPIVFSIAGDPVQLGFVASMNRPGGNLTGWTNLNVELDPKRLELLHELFPRATVFGHLVNPNNPYTGSEVTGVQAAARAMGLSVEVLTASTNLEIDAAFVNLIEKRANALLISPDNLFSNRRVQITTLSARHAVPTIYPYREDAEAGGLMSYGANIPEEYRQVGRYTGRILHGEKPAHLPVLQPTKFELLINLQTAKTLGLTVPQTLLVAADEVIE
jgi:putative tryptophan/tyrosine transport system substrate-binding protein